MKTPLSFHVNYTRWSHCRFIHQHQLISAGLQVRIPEKGDFLIENKYLFEVGGRSKGKHQITGKENAYVIKDDIDIGYGNVMPMWLFGFLC